MVIKVFFVLSILSLGVTIALLGWQELFSREEEVEVHFRDGTRLLQAGAWDEATREFRLALSSPDATMQMAAHHNLALAFLQMALEGEGRVALHWAEDAIRHGEESLRIRPGSEDSAWNLELALRRAQELEEEQTERGGEGALRLLASFRLQEEATLGNTLQERLREVGKGRPATALGGPPW